MLFSPETARPNFFDLSALRRGRLAEVPPTFVAGDFSENEFRPHPSFDLIAAVRGGDGGGGAREIGLPLVISILYSSRQARSKGEFLLEIRTGNRIAEVHLGDTQGGKRLTAGPLFEPPSAITSCRLYAQDLDPGDSITIERLALTRQFDPQAVIPGFRYGSDAYGARSREALEENASALMAECHRDMLLLRDREGLVGSSSQDGVLPYVMEYAHRRFPYLIGNLNGLYWYGLDHNQPLADLTTLNGMRADDIILDCGSHTGHIACAMAAVGGANTKVICFDPFPQNNYLTDLNRRLTGLNIEVAHAGVGRETKAVLASNLHQMAVPHDNFPKKAYPLVALDDYYSSKPTFLKINVEGFELEALLGAQKILRDLRPRVFIELHPQFFAMTGASYRKIYDAFPAGLYKFSFHHTTYGDVFENYLDTEPLGNLLAEPIA